MAIVTTAAFRRAILTWSLPFVRQYFLRLFVNDYVPVATSKFANFQEPAGSWYGTIVLSQWSAPFLNLNGDLEIDEAIHAYTAGGVLANESVYGYFVADPNNLLVWAERAPLGPYPMSVGGQIVRVMPRLMAGALC